MGFWRDRTGGPQGQMPPPTVMTASGKRINLTDRNAVTAIARTKMGWQTLAWDYRDTLGELAGALRFRANAISKVALKIGQVVENDDEPVDTDSDQCTLDPALAKAAQECLDKLPWRNGYGFLGTMDTSFNVAGECWLHGSNDKGTETWEILSTDEVQPTGGGSQLGIVSVPGQPARPVDSKNEVLIRLWVPHPRFKQLSDSPMRSIQDVIEDIILIGRELRSAARSRIAANGVLFIPHGMVVVRPSRDNDDPADFTTELQAQLAAPIANEGDPGSVAPVVVEADKEDIAAVKHISLVRETSQELGDKLGRSLTRLAESIDVPPTVITGMQDTNHWNAYVIDATTFRNHLEPGVRIMVDSITQGYLRPSLIMPVTEGGYGFTEDQAAQVVVWYNAGKVTENANRGQDAKDAYDRFAIGPKTLRDALGYNDDDAPTTTELMTMLASKVSVDPATAGALIGKVFGIPITPAGPATPTTVVPSPPGGSIGGTPSAAPVAPRRALPPPAGGQSGRAVAAPTASGQTPTGARTASAAPGLRVLTNRKLVDIDAALLERLHTASEAAIQRALEKANARIRSAAQGKMSKTDLAEHGDHLAAVLKDTGVAELGVTEDVLLAAAFTYLEGKFIEWTAAAVRQAVKVAAGMLGLELTTVAELTRTLTARIPHAWHQLHQSLRQRALAALFGRHGTETPSGEAGGDVVRAGDIRAALSLIGGQPAGGVEPDGRAVRGPVGGIGSGTDITDMISRRSGPPVGLMWVYGAEPRNTFPPHLALDDHRYDSPQDHRLVPPPKFDWLGAHMHPGDHAGCRCHTVSAWIFPENAAPMPLELRQMIAETVAAPESAAMRNERMLAEMDDAAGRTNTTAQRARDQRDRILRLRQEWLDGMADGA